MSVPDRAPLAMATLKANLSTTFSSSPSGRDPSKLFHRSVNKRNVPDYYDVIKEPMALSILKAKINKREYKQFSDFVRDCALVWIAILPNSWVYTSSSQDTDCRRASFF